MKGKALGVLNDYLARQDLLALDEIKRYCENEGWVEDFENIVLPLYEKYGWDILVSIGNIKWERRYGNDDNEYEYYVVYLNLDRLSTLVEWNDTKHKWVAID